MREPWTSHSILAVGSEDKPKHETDRPKQHHHENHETSGLAAVFGIGKQPSQAPEIEGEHKERHQYFDRDIQRLRLPTASRDRALLPIRNALGNCSTTPQVPSIDDITAKARRTQRREAHHVYWASDGHGCRLPFAFFASSRLSLRLPFTKSKNQPAKMALRETMADHTVVSAAWQMDLLLYCTSTYGVIPIVGTPVATQRRNNLAGCQL
jgi:hypothetical protein